MHLLDGCRSKAWESDSSDGKSEDKIGIERLLKICTQVDFHTVGSRTTTHKAQIDTPRSSKGHHLPSMIIRRIERGTSDSGH